jgi:hypothetical protein
MAESLTYQIQDFALHDEIVQAIHHFLDPGRPVPPVEVQNVDVGGAQLLQAGFDADVHGLDAVSDIKHLLRDGVVSALVVGAVLRRDDELVADVALLRPFSDKRLRAFVLAV